MAMSAVRCDKSWRTRAFNGKQDSMLTAQGQLFRTIAPMVPRDDQQPKCLQTYMFGRDKATMFRMQNMKKSLKGKDKVGYKDIFDKLDVILRGAGNKYLDEFMAVHDYVQKNWRAGSGMLTYLSLPTHQKAVVFTVALSMHLRVMRSLFYFRRKSLETWSAKSC